ncbi:MAG: hypothetical protein ABL908_08575, partial [Hyphomicrobium sp.]
PAIMEAQRAAGRVRGVDRMSDQRFNQVVGDVSGIDDTAAHRLIETVGAGSNMPSASTVRNTVMDRASGAKEDMRGFLWRMANDASGANAGQLFHGTPAPAEVLEIAETMALNAREMARGAYTAAHNKVAMGPQVYSQLYREVNGSLARIRGRANTRAGEYAAQMHNAAQEIEDLIQQTGGRYSMQQLQDARAGVRHIIRTAERKGDDATLRVLQPFYDDLTAAMERANPVWRDANLRWAGIVEAEDALLLGQTFAKKAGVKQRQQIDAFEDMAPEAQTMMRIGFMQRLEDDLANLGDAASVSKLFDEPIRKVISQLFGRDALLALMRKLRDVKVGEISKGMLGNSRTAPRLQQGRIDDADIGVVASLQSANASAAKSWLTDMLINTVREYRNRALARALTTPISDTPAIAQQLHGLRRNQARRQNFDAPPTTSRRIGGAYLPNAFAAGNDGGER